MLRKQPDAGELQKTVLTSRGPARGGQRIALLGNSAQPGFGFPRGADLVYRCGKGYTRRDNVAERLVLASILA